MREKIKKLEELAKKLEPPSVDRKQWNRQVEAYADEFLTNMNSRKTFEAFAGDGRSLLDFSFQEEGRPMETLLEIVKKQVDTPGLNPASGGHLGYIPGGGVFPTALGDYMAAVTNRYAGVFFANPGAVRMENQIIRWMCQMFGYPDTALGNLTSGGSIANLIAVVSARDTQGIRAADIHRSPIYLTSQAHHSLQKAIRIAGLSEAPLRYIPVDENFHMDVDQLRTQVEKDQAAGLNPFLIIAAAGTTDTGAVDPLAEIGAIAREHQLWFHVDAAYGGFFILTSEIKERFAGIDLADSITVDPHKGLFLAYGSGAVLIRDVKAMQKTHYYQANYMQDTVDANQELSPADLSPELTKHFRGMRMWLPLQLFGIQPFRAALSQKIWLCRYFYEEVQKLGFEVGPYPDLSVMIYRYHPSTGSADEFNAALVKMVREDGRVFLSSTTINGIFWLRLAVLSFRTDLAMIDKCLTVLQEKVAVLEQSASANLKQ